MTFIYCFYHEPLHTSFETNIKKFPVSSYMALELNKHALEGYLKLVCEYGKTA